VHFSGILKIALSCAMGTGARQKDLCVVRPPPRTANAQIGPSIQGQKNPTYLTRPHPKPYGHPLPPHPQSRRHPLPHCPRSRGHPLPLPHSARPRSRRHRPSSPSLSPPPDPAATLSLPQPPPSLTHSLGDRCGRGAWRRMEPRMDPAGCRHPLLPIASTTVCSSTTAPSSTASRFPRRAVAARSPPGYALIMTSITFSLCARPGELRSSSMSFLSVCVGVDKRQSARAVSPGHRRWGCRQVLGHLVRAPGFEDPGAGRARGRGTPSLFQAPLQ
jgi:hypothetical protein